MSKTVAWTGLLLTLFSFSAIMSFVHIHSKCHEQYGRKPKWRDLYFWFVAYIVFSALFIAVFAALSMHIIGPTVAR